MVKNIPVGYEKSFEHFLDRNVKEAVRMFQEMTDDGVGFILSPQALNPFLKIIEIMGDAEHLIILPAYDSRDYNEPNKPAYLILKIGTVKMITNVIMEDF